MEDTTIEDTLKTVESLYIQKDYANALKILVAKQSELPSGLWNYNMGTVYAAMENWPLARLHLLRADILGTGSQEAVQNLELVESKLDVENLEKPLSLSDYLAQGSMIASEGILTSFALLILVIGLWNLRKQNSLKFLIGLFSTVLFVLGINWWIRSWPKAIVTKPQIIHEGPSGIFPEREELPAGVLVISSSSDGWQKIYYPSRFKGWIKNEGLKELE